jgi:hypothetical protein
VQRLLAAPIGDPAAAMNCTVIMASVRRAAEPGFAELSDDAARLVLLLSSW